MARAKLFSGGYLLFSMALAVLASVMLWILAFPVTSSDKVLSWSANGTALASAGLLFLKLMTRRLATVTWSVLGIVALLSLSLALNVLQYYW